jgi:hypothetical protein
MQYIGSRNFKEFFFCGPIQLTCMPLNTATSPFGSRTASPPTRGMPMSSNCQDELKEYDVVPLARSSSKRGHKQASRCDL